MNLVEQIQSAFSGMNGTVLAVSGGIDSIVLLHTFAENPPCAAVVCHVDHGLRKDAAGDTSFVKSEAKRLGFPFENIAIEIPTNGSIQNHARCQRRAALRRIAFKLGYPSVATAHHHDDWIETFFMATTRGGGMQSVEQRVRHDDGGVTWVKPFSYVPKEDLREFATARQISWREDPSNAKPDYTRNLVRAALDAATQQHGDGTLQSRIRFEETQAVARGVVDATIDKLLMRCDEPWCVRLHRETLRSFDPSLRHALVRRAAQMIGVSVSREAMSTIDAVLRDTRRCRETAKGLVVFSERDDLTLMKNFGRGLDWFSEISTPPRAVLADNLQWFGGRFESSEVEPKVTDLFRLEISGEVTVQGWSAGLDLPDGARKKLKEIPFARKWRVPVVTKEGVPVWIPGIWKTDETGGAWLRWTPKQIDK